MNHPSSFQRRVIMLLVLFAAYVLSAAPVHALYSSDRLKKPIPDALVTFYQPVNWLHKHTPLGGPMEVYDKWWNRTLVRS